MYNPENTVEAVPGNRDFGEAPGGVGQIDLNRQISLFRRRLRLYIGVVVVCFLAAVAICLVMQPKYTSVGQVMMDLHEQKVVANEQVMSSIFGPVGDPTAIDSQVQVLQSRQLAERVVAQMKLEEDPEFNSSLKKFSLRKILLPFPTNFDAQSTHVETVNNVLKSLTVSRDGLTYVIDVAFKSTSNQKSADIANAFIDNYLTMQREAKTDAGQHASEWLSRRIEELKGQVQTAETAVQSYKASHGLLNLTDAQGATPSGAVMIGQTAAQQELANLDGQLAAAKAQEAETVARLNTARSQIARGSNGLDVGEALSSPIIQELRRERAQASGAIADLQGKYGPKHPDLLKAQRQLSDLDKQIQGEVARITSNLEAQVQVARQRRASLEGSIGQSRGTLAANSSASVQLNELERNAQANRALYQSYLDRYKQTTTQRGLEEADAHVISRGSPSALPSSPNIPLYLIASILIGFGISLALVLLNDALETGIYTASDVETELKVAHVGSVPLLGSATDDVGRGVDKTDPINYVVNYPFSGLAESLRSIRSSIRFARLDKPAQVVAVTSALPGEGKTTTAVSLGRVSAMGGQSTVVVDCDMRRRTVNNMFDNKPTFGLLEVLSGQCSLDQALRYDETSGAYFLPLAECPFVPKDVFTGPAIDRLLAELRQRFELVILDTAPMLPVADTRNLAAKADTVILLVRWKKTPRAAARNAIKLIIGAGAHLAGVALSQVNVKEQMRSGYGDTLYYYQSYSSYYLSDGRKAAGEDGKAIARVS